MTAPLIPSIPTNSEASQIVGTVNKVIAEINAALASPAGGNVTGPGSSTPGHLATFADTTGKVIQDGGSPYTGVVAPVNANAATLAVTPAMANGAAILLNRAVGVAATLPAATGTGNRYKFFVATVLSGGSYVIRTASGSDVITGGFVLYTITGTGTNFWFPISVSGADTTTLNGGTQGGTTVGEWVEFTDVAVNTWYVMGITIPTAVAATPFSKV